jgi:hypothetical protein
MLFHGFNKRILNKLIHRENDLDSLEINTFSAGWL